MEHPKRIREVLADSFYFIALLNRRDLHHRVALEVLTSYEKSQNVILVTTGWVLTEVGDALSGIHVRKRVFQCLEELFTRSGIIIITDFDPWFHRGLHLFGNRPDKSWSLTDCISFEIMSARGITEALTGDHHFLQAGFHPLLAPESLG